MSGKQGGGYHSDRYKPVESCGSRVPRSARPIPAGNGTAMANSLLPNGTAAPGFGEEGVPAASELRVFNMVLIAVATCVLAVGGLYCLGVCYSRTRQSKRAHVYESAVTRDEPASPVAVKAVRRSTSFINPLAFLRRPPAADPSRIFYIYSNPLPVGAKEDRREEGVGDRPPPPPPPSIQEYASDPGSGVTLDPPVFYMQL